MKRHGEAVKKDNFYTLVVFGDLSSLPLDHLTSLIESVRKEAKCFSQYGSAVIRI